MIRKTLTIDGKEVKFRASATVPRLYRFKFRRDILVDLQELRKAYLANQKDGAEFEMVDLEIFENAAYIMAKHGDPDNVPETPEEWLDGFNVFSIYEILPEVLNMWALNMETTSESKKKLKRVTET